MEYKYGTLKKYIDDLAARLPAPGGGSASALTAAMGISLVSMVINFSLGKPKYARYEEELKSLLKKSEGLREEFLNLVDLDILAYKSRNIRDALNVPFMVCRLAYEGIKLVPGLVRRGNINLISDTAIAAIFLESAFASAFMNVEINLKSLGDKKLTQRIRRELKQKEGEIKKVRLETEVKVGEIIRR